MVVSLYNGIYKTLANDSKILELLNIDLNSLDLALSKALKIQKRQKPQNPTDNIPLICFFSLGGQKEPKNSLVHNSVFVFDIYTNDDVEKAHLIATRIVELFDEEIPEFSGIGTFSTYWQDSFESDTDLPNTYCFTTVFKFSWTC